MQPAATLSPAPAPRTLVASIPGGQARQYRVQFQPPGQQVWRMFACFRKAEPAEGCARDLASRGVLARVVAVRINPTAA